MTINWKLHWGFAKLSMGITAVLWLVTRYTNYITTIINSLGG